MYKCEHFGLYELVDPATYNKYGEFAWQFMDASLLKCMDIIRDELKSPITVNNWKWGGNRSWSGLRTPDSPYYSIYSPHTRGSAIDFLTEGFTADYVRDVIRRLFNEGKLPVDGIRLEMGVSWIHIDVNNVTGIVEFYP